MSVDKEKNRARRQDMIQGAHLQHGVNLLHTAFSNADPLPPPGVRDTDDAFNPSTSFESAEDSQV